MFQWTLVVLIAVALATPTAVAGEMTFKSIVVFGDSLSDPGNDFALIKTQNTPPYDNLDPMTIIPHAPYAKGGHHYSNGATWVEQFAKSRRMAQYVTPAWQSSGAKAANYAVGGGRAYDDQINKNLPQQVGRFLEDVGEHHAPADALYVIEFGGNDIRDALPFFALGDYTGAFNIIGAALDSIKVNIINLNNAGASKFLIWNAPDLGLTPAILTLDSTMPTPPGPGAVIGAVWNLTSHPTFGFNPNLESLLDYLSVALGIEIKLFNVYQKVHDLVEQHEAYGLEVVNAACVTPNIPPFDCKEPDEYLFWYGIHPTKTAHGIFAQEVAALLSQ